MLAAITCYFNPAGYKNIQDNYFTFRDNLKGVPLYTIELSFDGTFIIPDAVHVLGNQNNVMWQKERLLNLLIEQLPAKYDKVAWLDADIIFDRRWARAANKLLDTHPVIQLFDAVDDTDSSGETFISYPSTMAYLLNGMESQIAKPGYCWAARRDAIPDGLYDGHVLGGGDLMMVYAWLGQWDGGMIYKMNIEWKRSFLMWAAKQHRSIKRNVGYLPGSIQHLFHGTRENRKYVERTFYLVSNGFDPTVDIRIGDNGLFEWCSDKPVMHQQVADYFIERDEDSP